MAWSSPRASSLAWRIAASESAALSGRRPSRWAATPAWTLISPMVWETTSCSSLAIRSRSSVDPAAGLLLPGPLGPLGPVPQLGHIRPPGPHRLAPPHGREHRHGDVQRLAVEHGLVVEEQLDRGDRHRRHGRGQPGQAPREGQGHGPQGGVDGQLRRPLGVGAGGIGEPAGHGDGQHPERPTAPEQEGRRPAGQQQLGEGVGVPPGRRVAERSESSTPSTWTRPIPRASRTSTSRARPRASGVGLLGSMGATIGARGGPGIRSRA